MAVLVTGAGLLGSWTARLLVAQGEEVVLFDYAPPLNRLQSLLGSGKVAVIRGNICERADLTQLLSQFPIDGIIHTAGVMGPLLLQHPTLGLRVNVEGTLLVAELAQSTPSRKIVFCSSLAIYGNACSSGAYQEAQRPIPCGMYGATKAAAECILLAFAQQQDLKPTILRLAGLFGPGTYLGGAWLAPAIDTLLRRLLHQERVVIDFFPPEGMEMLYVKDAARAVVKAYRQATWPHTTFNIGTGHLCPAQALLVALKELFPRAQIALDEHKTKPITHATIKPLAINQAQQLLGFVAQYDLQRALEDYATELTGST